MLTAESIETPFSPAKKMIGSMIIVEAKSMDEVTKTIKEDIYYTEGVVSELVLVPDPTIIRIAFYSGILRSL
jgi:hypothetical protein